MFANGHLLIHVSLCESAGSSSRSSTLEEQKEEEEEDFSAVPCRAQWKYTRLLGVLSKRKGGKKKKKTGRPSTSVKGFFFLEAARLYRW